MRISTPRNGDHIVVGVLGGMGPDATVDFMRRVIKLTPAGDDIDHLHMIVDNNPKVPSRIKALIDGDGEDPAPELASMARGLQRAGADILTMPCNTAHNYADDIVAAVDIPLLNMVELTADRILSDLPGTRTIGLLASTALKVTRLYDHAFAPHGVDVIFPRQQDEVMAMIRSVKSNTLSDDQISLFGKICQQLVADGADVLLLACTELSVLASRLENCNDFLDSLTILAETVADLGSRR